MEGTEHEKVHWFGNDCWRKDPGTQGIGSERCSVTDFINLETPNDCINSQPCQPSPSYAKPSLRWSVATVVGATSYVATVVGEGIAGVATVVG